MFEIKLADGTETEGLPEILATLLRQNLEQHPHKVKAFNALDIVVGIRITDVPMEVTLAFRKGHLVIHKELVMDPKLLITTDSNTIFDLNLIRVRFGLPWYLDAQGRKVLRSLLSGSLKIKGMWAHMGSLTRLTKVISVD